MVVMSLIFPVKCCFEYFLSGVCYSGNKSRRTAKYKYTAFDEDSKALEEVVVVGYGQQKKVVLSVQ